MTTLERVDGKYQIQDRNWSRTRRQWLAIERINKLARDVVRFGGFGAPKKIVSLQARIRRRQPLTE